jgi:YHS domain-containing protein
MRILLPSLALAFALASCDRKETPVAAKPPPAPGMQAAPAGAADKAKDPICSMWVEKSKAPATLLHEGVTYYFCSDGCRKKFEADPKAHAQPCSCKKRSDKCKCEHCGNGKHEACDCP